MEMWLWIVPPWSVESVELFSALPCAPPFPRHLTMYLEHSGTWMAWSCFEFVEPLAFWSLAFAEYRSLLNIIETLDFCLEWWRLWSVPVDLGCCDEDDFSHGLAFLFV